MENEESPCMGKTLIAHLERYRNKVFRLGFTPKRSFVVDSCDFLLEESTNGKKTNSRKN